MRAGHEGVVVKGLNSKYKMGSRAEKNGWFKIKPDYGSQTNLDLAIVAARVDKHGKFETFYVAAKDGPESRISLDGQKFASKIDMKFRIMAPLMASIKKIDFDHLMNIVHGEKGWLPDGQIPDWLTNPNLEKHQNRRYVRKDQIVVVEIRASGVKDGNLQFPRIINIRQDKNLEEIDTVGDVLEHDDKLRERHSDGSDDERITEPANKRRRVLQVHENYKIAKPSIDLKIISSGLKNKKVCVLQGSPEFEHRKLQEILQSLGAEIVANPTKNTDFLVATNPKHVRVAGVIKRNSWNIVHGSWLFRCKDEGTLLPWKSEEMIHISNNANFNLFHNQICDEQLEDSNLSSESNLVSPNRPIEETSPKKIINDAKDDELNEKSSSDEEIQSLDDIIRISPKDLDLIDEIPQATHGNLFEDLIFYIHETFPNKSVKECQAQIKNHNGKISNKLDSTVTHVVIGQVTKDQMDELFDWNESKDWLGNFVTVDWIKDAVVEDDRYLAPINLHQMIV